LASRFSTLTARMSPALVTKLDAKPKQRTHRRAK
jgi:hypothetical protein